MKPIFEKKAESQAADEIDEELEDLLTESGVSLAGSSPGDMRMDLQKRHQRALERALSLADAFTVRNDLDAALKVIDDARKLLGPMPDLESRARLLRKRLEVLEDEVDDADTDDGGESDADDESNPPEFLHLPEDPDAPQPLAAARKREVLETLLRRISARRAEA